METHAFGFRLPATPRRTKSDFLSVSFHTTMKLYPTYLLIVTAALLSAPFSRAQFTPGPNPISDAQVTAQKLSSGTGLILPGGGIFPPFGDAVTMSGTSQLANFGFIIQVGLSGQGVYSDAEGAALTISNAGLISTFSGDAVRVLGPNSSVFLENLGTISSAAGGLAINFGSITADIFNIGQITTVGQHAVALGENGSVTNTGIIQATLRATETGTPIPSPIDGILARRTGVSVTNVGTISGGRHGITGGDSSRPISITVTNSKTISGQNGSGLNIDGFGSSAKVTNAAGATIQGNVLANATNGDGDGLDVDGVLELMNFGTVEGLGAKGVDNGRPPRPNHSEGVAAGGGTIDNRAGGMILGKAQTGEEGRGILVDDGNGGATRVAATKVINAGTIHGFSGFAVKLVGDFPDLIINEATGVIRGAGTGAAIQMGNDDDVLINRGLIQGHNGLAIDLENGNDTLFIGGASVAIAGDISGGTGTNLLIIAGPFTYSNGISDFRRIDVNGNFSLTNTAKLKLSLDGLVRGLTYDAVDSTGGTLTLDGTIDVQSSISLVPNNTFNLIDFESLDATNFDVPRDLLLPTLAPGLSWGTGAFLSDGVITVVPEPTVTLLLGVGLGVFLFRRATQRIRGVVS